MVIGDAMPVVAFHAIGPSVVQLIEFADVITALLAAVVLSKD